MKKRAIFLDRDGTIIVDRGYLDSIKGVRLMPQVGEALAEFQAMGFALIIITNQSGIGRGKFTLETVHAQHNRLHDLLKPFGVKFDDIQICPHSPEENCSCRKPEPTMLLKSAQDLNIDLSQSYMIGDKPSDIFAGINAGCQTIYLGSSFECPQATTCASSLKEASSFIKTTIQQEKLSMSTKRIVAVLPARYGSSRFPGKPLAIIAGKPMVQWAYERACKAKLVDEVIIATDDQRIIDVVQSFGGKAVMTSPNHATGTDRIAEAIQNIDADIVINVQGDEPLLPSNIVDELIAGMLKTNAEMGTVASPFKSAGRDPNDPNAVKVVVDKNQFALYFSRSPIPFCRQGGTPVEPLLHWGIYAYQRSFLEQFIHWEQSELERCEMLEQLRALENGAKIFIVKAQGRTVGVDTPEDIAIVESILQERGEI